MNTSDRPTVKSVPRVLVVTNLYPPVIVGGYEVECRDVVEHLGRSYEIEVLTSWRGRWSVSRPEPSVHRILPFTPETRLGVLLAPLYTWLGRRRVDRFLDGRDYDIVFVWNAAGLPHVTISRLARRELRMAFRVCEQWFGGLYDRDLYLRYLRARRSHRARSWAVLVRALDRVIDGRADRDLPHPATVCWNSEFLRQSVPVPRGVDVVHETVVFPINAAADRLASLRRRPVADEPRVVFVGRVVEDKGLDTAIGAIAELEHRYGVRARLRVVGTGTTEYLGRLRRHAEVEGVSDRVDLVGPRRGDDLAEELVGASAWVVPSRWDEPAPMVALEASLARVPLVATRVGGIPELVRDREEALLVERDDVAGCASALAEVLRGGQLIAERTDRAFQRAQNLSFGPYLARIDEFLTTSLSLLPDGDEHDRPSSPTAAGG